MLPERTCPRICVLVFLSVVAPYQPHQTCGFCCKRVTGEACICKVRDWRSTSCATLRCKSKPACRLIIQVFSLIHMTNFKPLFAAALLTTVAALSFAKAPAVTKHGVAAKPTSVTSTAGPKVKAKTNRHKSARSEKSNNKANHAARKHKNAEDSNVSNSKGPGLEAY
jgi:hypothetical protein